MERVRVHGWSPDFQVVSAIRALRRHTLLGMSDAKRCIEDVLNGYDLEVYALSPMAATDLVAELGVAGAVADLTD